ncbi:MAG: hypothetical protein JXQ27_05405 [Acidobacteria bacterium]|nr:hypothetical protein [Acidobacteriota bacterium]
MQFIVIAYDGIDADAPRRRASVREAHLEIAREMHEQGHWLYAAAILDDDGGMIGSMILCEFSSLEEMQSRWLSREPYIQGDVWKEMEVNRAQVAPFFLNQ